MYSFGLLKFLVTAFSKIGSRNFAYTIAKIRGSAYTWFKVAVDNLSVLSRLEQGFTKLNGSVSEQGRVFGVDVYVRDSSSASPTCGQSLLC